MLRSRMSQIRVTFYFRRSGNHPPPSCPVSSETRRFLNFDRSWHEHLRLRQVGIGKRHTLGGGDGWGEPRSDSRRVRRKHAKYCPWQMRTLAEKETPRGELAPHSCARHFGYSYSNPQLSFIFSSSARGSSSSSGASLPYNVLESFTPQSKCSPAYGEALINTLQKRNVLRTSKVHPIDRSAPSVIPRAEGKNYSSRR